MAVRLLILSIALLGLLAAGRAWQLSHMPPAPLPAAAMPKAEDQPSAGLVALSPEAQAKIGHLLSRPPFAEDRRPFQPEPAAPGKTEPEPPEAPFAARLLGIITEGGERFAVLTSNSGTTTDIVRRGGRVEGWVVEKIDDKGIVLRKGSATVEILLFENR